MQSDRDDELREIAEQDAAAALRQVTSIRALATFCLGLGCLLGIYGFFFQGGGASNRGVTTFFYGVGSVALGWLLRVVATAWERRVRREAVTRGVPLSEFEAGPSRVGPGHWMRRNLLLVLAAVVIGSGLLFWQAAAPGPQPDLDTPVPASSVPREPISPAVDPARGPSPREPDGDADADAACGSIVKADNEVRGAMNERSLRPGEARAIVRSCVQSLRGKPGDERQAAIRCMKRADGFIGVSNCLERHGVTYNK